MSRNHQTAHFSRFITISQLTRTFKVRRLVHTAIGLVVVSLLPLIPGHQGAVFSQGGGGGYGGGGVGNGTGQTIVGNSAFQSAPVGVGDGGGSTGPDPLDGWNCKRTSEPYYNSGFVTKLDCVKEKTQLDCKGNKITVFDTMSGTFSSIFPTLQCLHSEMCSSHIVPAPYCPTFTCGSNGGQACSSGRCGSSLSLNGAAGIYMPKALSALDLERSFTPNNLLYNSSFSPGHYSTVDSQVQLYPTGSLYGGGTTGVIRFLDANTQRVFTLEDGVMGGTPDGIFNDYNNYYVKQATLLNSSNTAVANFGSAVALEVIHKNKYKERYELIDLDPGSTTMQLAGRLVSRTDPNGQSMTIAYKTWTPTEITTSPDRQWQINTVTDSAGNVATFTYNATQQSGRWAVSQVAYNNGQSQSFAYTSGRLTAASNPANYQTSYTYGQDPVAQTATVTVKRDYENNGSTVYHLTNDYMTMTVSGEQQVINQPVGIFRMTLNGSNEVSRMVVPPANASWDQLFQYTGGSAATNQISTVCYKDYMSWQAAAGTGGTSSSDPYYGITGTQQSGYYGANTYQLTTDQVRRGTYTNWTNETGQVQGMEYDSAGRPTKVTYTADGTYEQYGYTADGLLTRKRNRDGSVSVQTFDANGNMVSRKIGLVDQSGTDVQGAGYQEAQFVYYPVGHVNAGLLQSKMDALYFVFVPDWQYKSKFGCGQRS